ncbi:MAG TPA: 2-C-methyl-D-erythritol 4-phosphate cytidylyltransferase [Gemmatimonadota bacterium]|nr:2-C-methyl-D-erythritol 4-phosphate cytidylyltransferase [Gemmatimonadota bacterium]
MSGRIGAVIVAGGTGSRVGGPPKQFREVGGRPMLGWSCARFTRHPEVEQIVVVVPGAIATDPPAWLRRLDVRLTAGGATRRASVRAGLAALPDVDVVLIHDAARPFVSAELVGRLARAAREGPVIPVLALPDTIKRMRPAEGGGSSDRIEATFDRDLLRAAQTPQAFPLELIRRLHEAAASEGIEPTDDADLCERAGVEVRTVPGERLAFKITHADDLAMAEWLVASGRIAPPEAGP